MAGRSVGSGLKGSDGRSAMSGSSSSMRTWPSSVTLNSLRKSAPPYSTRASKRSFPPSSRPRASKGSARSSRAETTLARSTLASATSATSSKIRNGPAFPRTAKQKKRR